MKTRILGTGSFLPPGVVTNNDLGRMMDTSDEWIVQRTGIRERRWVEGATTTTDLALEAARRALESADVAAGELDMIIFATLSPDHEFPGAGCFLQAKLGVSGIPALDVRQQCTGFLHGLSIADHFIRAGTYKKILLVGAEIHSKGLDKTTRGREISVLFGDGAGAVVLGAHEGREGILTTHLHADGRFARELWVKAPTQAVSGERINAEMLAAGEHYPQMNGRMVFVNAVKKMPEALKEALDAGGATVNDVDLFVLHQANTRISEMVCSQLQIPREKFFSTIEKYGNTTAATIPIGLDEAVRSGRIKPGMLVATAAFGSGFTWASALVRW